jgi:hypothetical protein
MTWFKILTFCLLSGAYPASLPFKSCGDGTLTIQDLSVEPFPLQKSTESTLSVHGVLNETVNSGQYSITVDVNGLQIYSKSGDICALDQSICPQTTGEKNIVKNFTIPSLAPSGSYKAHLKLNNEHLIACYSFEFELD